MKESSKKKIKYFPSSTALKKSLNNLRIVQIPTLLEDSRLSNFSNEPAENLNRAVHRNINTFI